MTLARRLEMCGSSGIAYVGYATTTALGGVSPTTITLSSGLTGGSRSAVQEGDLVIGIYAVASIASTDRSLAITDGTNNYTLIGSELYSTDTAAAANLRVAYKFMTSSPDSSTTFSATTGSSDAQAMAVMVFSGVNQSTPIDVTTVTATGIDTALANPGSITPASSGAMIAAIGVGATHYTGAVFTSSDLTGFISITCNDSRDAMLGFGIKAWEGGAFNPAQFGGGTNNNDEAWVAITLALRPAL